MKKLAIGIGGIIAVVLILRLIAPMLAPSEIPDVQLVLGADNKTLVVALHGFSGNPGLD